MRSELDGMVSGEGGSELGGACRVFDHFVGGGEVICFRHVRQGRTVHLQGDLLPVAGVWLGNDATGVCVVLVLFVIVEGIGQLIHLLHEGIIQVGGAVPLRPGDGGFRCGKFGGRIRRGLCLVDAPLLLFLGLVAGQAAELNLDG